jgi:two-component system sensor histidine kinase MprB
MRGPSALGRPVWRHVRTNLRTRFALAFAVVAFVVAAMVGLLSYHAAADRIYQEVDASLRSTATAIDNGQTTGLAAPALPDRGRGTSSPAG